MRSAPRAVSDAARASRRSLAAGVCGRRQRVALHPVHRVHAAPPQACKKTPPLSLGEIALPRATACCAIAALLVWLCMAAPCLAQTPLGMAIRGPAALNSNAASDSGTDESPQVTTDGAGNGVAVWHSYEDLGGTIGTDMDIPVTRSTDNGTNWSAPPP